MSILFGTFFTKFLAVTNIISEFKGLRFRIVVANSGAVALPRLRGAINMAPTEGVASLAIAVI